VGVGIWMFRRYGGGSEAPAVDAPPASAPNGVVPTGHPASA